MFHRLEELEVKYSKVLDALSEPDVYSDKDRFKKLSKEKSELEPILEGYLKWKETSAEIDEYREALSSGDKELIELAKEELPSLEEQKEQIEHDLKILLLPKDPNDDKDIILEIRAGTGGDEAAIFAGDLLRMYSRFAETRNWSVQIIESSSSSMGGYKEVIAQISGDHVYSNLKYESGTHRVQRVPATESQGRVHTSAVTVAVLPEAEEVDVNVEEKDLRIDVFRSSGPGGQSVNTTDSAVRITHIPTGLVVTCQDEKSQHKNKAQALKVLRARLYDMEQQKIEAERSAERKSQVGSGDRSGRIRTYNFPQGRVTDHRINITLYQLPTFISGEIDEMITQLRTFFQAEMLKESVN